MKDYLTIEEAAAELGVHAITVRRRVREGRLVPYRSGADRRRYWFRAEDVARLRQPSPARPRTRRAAR